MITLRAGQTHNVSLSSDMRITEANADSVAGWWLSGGISAGNVAGVWTPKGKASQAASYLRDAGDQGNANIDPAVVGGVAPSWDTLIGWTGNGSSMYLITGIVPLASWSWFVRFTGAATDAARFLFGGDNGASARFLCLPNLGNQVYYGNGGILTVTPRLTAGTLAAAGNAVYRDGNPETGTIGAWSGTAGGIYVLADNLGGPSGYTEASISHIAFYKTVITAVQNAALTAATV